MDANVLFGKALGLGSGWKVVKSEMDVAGRELKIWLDFESGSQFACPRCEKFSPVHDTMEKKWRHLDFWQHRTELIARVPRTNCQEHGILQAAVPWARPGSGFTLMMEAMILLLGQQMSVSAAARHLAESDKRLDHHRGANQVVVKIVREKTALGQLIYEKLHYVGKDQCRGFADVGRASRGENDFFSIGVFHRP